MDVHLLDEKTGLPTCWAGEKQRSKYKTTQDKTEVTCMSCKAHISVRKL